MLKRRLKTTGGQYKPYKISEMRKTSPNVYFYFLSNLYISNLIAYGLTSLYDITSISG